MYRYILRRWRGRAHTRRWREKNKEKTRTAAREHYQKNKIEILRRRRELDRQRRATNPAYREKQRLKGQKEYLKRKEEAPDRYRLWKEQLRRDIFNAYGNKCVCCGETERKFLTIDHVNNDGNKERARSKSELLRRRGGGVHIYSRIRKEGYPATYRVLCWNCNCGRAQNGGICPHEAKRI